MNSRGSFFHYVPLKSRRAETATVSLNGVIILSLRQMRTDCAVLSLSFTHTHTDLDDVLHSPTTLFVKMQLNILYESDCIILFMMTFIPLSSATYGCAGNQTYTNGGLLIH